MSATEFNQLLVHHSDFLKPLAINLAKDMGTAPFILYFEGYKYQEIAEMLNEPLGTIKSRIHFARKLLKLQIER